jgi:hypothetical protein
MARPTVSLAATSLARSKPHLVRSVPGPEGIEYLIEKSRRQKTIVVSISVPYFAQIISGPDELIALAHDDPRTVIIKAEMLFDGVGNFNGYCCVFGRPMRHREHSHQRFTVLLTFDGKCDDTGAIFATFFLSALRFVIP